MEYDGENNAELLALQRIDETCKQLQTQGNYLEALECMERGLVLRQHFFGADSDEVWRACKVVGEMCNLLAMTYLQQEDFAMVLELLKKAEILTERDNAGRAVTFNNLACYYRRQGKLHAALQYLQKALKIENKLDQVDNPADTYLNTCAVLSQLGRHQSALEHAQQALILLQEELSRVLGPMADGNEAPKADRIAVLAIAYHNVGVEYEFLKKFDQSLQSYRKGVEVSERFLGPDHAITVTLRNSCIAARRAIMVRDPQARLQNLESKGRKGRGGGAGTRRAKPAESQEAMMSPRPDGAAEQG
uniref:Kinesin light chain n=1 Tax=Florenciella parvula TaxID=236787 RepID=A0A7S2CPG4_9STRA|mmetsp:Transcript_30703/g.62683  ORF Transcript_30703/g.62683 Transcript_30703/m.62683 type:complete len:304 (+) Transcript_30703:96-1007(+)|eukprot:CAMPEP_0119506128 /NCGR_PEP_ID=MMETSP1344-20130328/26457_1 /TAXON_ID=236787 /ORGANISM="Florenciella parvula, Strain CCMP2471" /LENGTH=303 /DNA_ID=CAMNT_0007542643 /DNA_START=122 /DNA_END=1033 /DNA_ORIENTATION=-